MAVNFQNMIFSKDVDMNESLFESDEDFVNFTKEWMRHYVPSSMDSFSITFSKFENFFLDVQNLINFSLDHQSKSLTLDFSDPSWKQNEDNFDFNPLAFYLPLHAYSNATHVESLALFSCKFSPLGFRNFTSLKHLSLGYMHLEASTIVDVLSSCPSLKSILLKRCRLDNFHDITLEHINSLVFDNCKLDDKSFLIEAPRLKYLMYKGEMCQFGLEINKYLFTEAVLDFTTECQYKFYEDDGVYLQTLLRDLYSVTTLTVCSFMLQLLPHGEEPVYIQELNVRTLKLNAALHLNELEGIGCLFNNCPLLETLIIDVCSPQGKIFDDYVAPHKFIGFVGCASIRNKLENFEMNGFTGELYQNSMLKCLLSAGSNLKKLTIKVSREGGDPSVYARKAQYFLEQCEQASRDLQIVIC